MKRFEIITICITLAFIMFLTGHFLGSRNDADSISVKTGISIKSDSQNDNTEDTIEEQKDENTEETQKTPERIDINTASAADFTELDGIGEVIAERIVEYRAENGKFDSVEELLEVNGIGEKKFEGIKDLVYVSQEER